MLSTNPWFDAIWGILGVIALFQSPPLAGLMFVLYLVFRFVEACHRNLTMKRGVRVAPLPKVRAFRRQSEPDWARVRADLPRLPDLYWFDPAGADAFSYDVVSVPDGQSPSLAATLIVELYERSLCDLALTTVSLLRVRTRPHGSRQEGGLCPTPGELQGRWLDRPVSTLAAVSRAQPYSRLCVFFLVTVHANCLEWRCYCGEYADGSWVGRPTPAQAIALRETLPLWSRAVSAWREQGPTDALGGREMSSYAQVQEALRRHSPGP